MAWVSRCLAERMNWLILCMFFRSGRHRDTSLCVMGHHMPVHKPVHIPESGMAHADVGPISIRRSICRMGIGPTSTRVMLLLKM